MKVPRPEYPRPDFVRKEWLNLNGSWSFDFDDDDRGLKQGWVEKPSLSRNIIVPFPFQSELSEINEKGFHDIFWYYRDAELPPEWLKSGRTMLHIGACDYSGTLWVNGKQVSKHRGGYTPWSSDITQFVRDGKAGIVVRGVDTQSRSQPRGKQHWELQSSGIMYTRVSGIWQTVWLEHVPDCYIQSCHIVSRLNPDQVTIDTDIAGDDRNLILSATVLYECEEIAYEETRVDNGSGSLEIDLPDARLWSPDDPFLYEIHLTLKSGNNEIDSVRTYTGIREISSEGRTLLLNNKPIRFKGVLDQGYFPGGVYTASTDAEIRRDVEIVHALGFNGVRKHQKVEDPRFYHWCDLLGVLVWAEMGNAWEFTPESCDALYHEFPHAVLRDWNHPSIIAWVPINESWGIPNVKDDKTQQDFLARMAQLTRRLDPTRLVVDNSGWCHIDTDIIDLHPYTGDPREMAALLDEIATTGKADNHYEFPVWVGDGKDLGQPIVISEYGGIALEMDIEQETKEDGGWGYGRSARSPQELIARFEELTQTILRHPEIAGYTYTQLTDVEQEVNGLLTFDRQPKAPLALFSRAQKTD